MEEEKNNSPYSSGVSKENQTYSQINLNIHNNNNQIISQPCQYSYQNKNAISNCSQINTRQIEDEVADEKPNPNLFVSEKLTIQSSFNCFQQKTENSQMCHNSQFGQQNFFQIQSRQQCQINERDQTLSQQSQIVGMNFEQSIQNQNQYQTTAESNNQSYYSNVEGGFDPLAKADLQYINNQNSNRQIVQNQIQCQTNEDLDQAQFPYPTLQKKQIQPCCAQQNNDLCKYTSFLFSNEETAKFEALKYFECNIKNYSTTDLLRLFNHKFIDCLVEMSKNFKSDAKTAQLAMRVIFGIAQHRKQDLQFNNKNIFFDKLLALDFPQIINKLIQEKNNSNNQRKCCFSYQINEFCLALNKYKYEQDHIQAQNRTQTSCKQKPKACIFSNLFK